MSLNSGTALRPLSEVAGGERVQVVEIVFDTVRLMCPTLGLRPGDILDCETRMPYDIVLRSTNGRRVVVDRFYASFIAIQILGRTESADPDGARTITRNSMLM